ncbi:class I SAM-dependent methyltransferase [Mongoliitalea daihaiensis]|uniref:class I SAM-dependent methyltransferase n=1 Tax=Mongoliitalea daihaiensis TaxID=2782006 RepID=UPI001F233185|nr:class I SAM-dependent methyltransferase [Mongoliitalea daihaiensis]UJP65935.1 class I SAM-dependent methyltransferase [Mongoliitalea daihaiensis]
MSLERLNKCPLCKSGLFLNHREIKDHSVSKESFILCECASCNLVFTNPRPNQESIHTYYQSDAYISHQDKITSITDILYKLVRKYTLRTKINLLNSLKPSQGSLLDIGCGTGYLLEAANKKGWICEGIEPGKDARKLAKKKGLRVNKSLDDLKEKQFDCISLFHVLEHIHLLRKDTKKILRLLKETGYLIIAVPNRNSLDANKYQANWAAWDVPRHLYHFDQRSFQKFTEEFGLEIIDQKPMIFDSYYVSMLSEKIVGSSPTKTLWKGLVNGYTSNKWAANNQGDYSSILFILKKK